MISHLPEPLLCLLENVMRFLGLREHESENQTRAITRRREELSARTDDQLKSAARAIRGEADVVETFSLAAVIAERVLGLRMFDVQILGGSRYSAGTLRRCRPARAKLLPRCPP